MAPAPAVANKPQAPAQAPGGAPASDQLALTFTAAFPASAQSAALNLSSALQTNAAQILQPVSVKHGPFTITGSILTQSFVLTAKSGTDWGGLLDPFMSRCSALLHNGMVGL